jgi:hypothetical protein
MTYLYMQFTHRALIIYWYWIKPAAKYKYYVDSIFIILHSTRNYSNAIYVILEDVIFRDIRLNGADVNCVSQIRTFAMLHLSRAETLQLRGSGCLQWHY